MSRQSCCTILVWVMLQLIYFSPILNRVRPLEQVEYYKKFHPEMQIYFTQKLEYELSQSTVDDKWKNRDFDLQRMTKMKSMPTLLRHIGTVVGFHEQERLLTTLSNEGFQSVSSRDKSISKSKTVFSFERIRKYTVDLNVQTTICNLKLIHMSKCNNLLEKQIGVSKISSASRSIFLVYRKEGSKIISIHQNSDSSIFSATMQLLCMLHNNCYTWTLEWKHELIHDTENFIFWILKYDLTTNCFEGLVYNIIFKDVCRVNVKMVYYNGYGRSLLRLPTILNSHLNSSNYSCNVNKSSFKHDISNSKETTAVPNDILFIRKANSRKNRVLLSVNSDTSLNEEKRGINTAQETRYAENKKVQSTNNQRDSPNGNHYASKVERRRKRRSRRRLAKDSTFAVEAKRAATLSSSSSSSSSREADATTKRDGGVAAATRISFSSDNEADYRHREIDRQIEADFAKIKDTLRLEKGEAISREMPRWASNAAKNNRQSVSQPAIDTREPEIITAKRVCIAPHCQQVIRHGLRAKSQDSNELPANSRRGNVAREQNGIAAVAAVVVPGKVVDEKMQPGNNDDRKLVGEALIILNKNASPFSIVQKSNDNAAVNLKYSVESISLGLDELLKMGKEVMKKELDNAGQNETKRAGLSCKDCLKYAKENNETYRGLQDDEGTEGTKLEEQLKELRSMHIQREYGFTNSGKNEMRFAAGDEYTFKKDEAARHDNEYSPGHVKRRKKRCRRKHKSPLTSNILDKSSRLGQNRISYRRKMKANTQKLIDDIPFGYDDVKKRSPRIKKNDPYREYKESAEEKLLSVTKLVEYSGNEMETSQETLLPTNHKEVTQRKVRSLKDPHVKVYKSSVPRKSDLARTRKSFSKNKHNSQPLSMHKLANDHQSQIKRKHNKPGSTSDTLSRDISDIYYNVYDDPEMAVENGNSITDGARRKLLSLNSMEYDDESPIPANEESNYDYVEKFYGDHQLHERGPPQLHYFRINLPNATLPANAGREGEASRIELAQCHVNKSMITFSANHAFVRKTGYSKRTLKSVAREENSVKKDPMRNLYLKGDLIGYDYDPDENESKEQFKRETDENEDPVLGGLFADGQEYEINVRGKLHLRLKDSESSVASEKSSKIKRSAVPSKKIEKSRKKHARRKFAAAPGKRTKLRPDEDSADAHKGDDGNLKSKVSNKTRKPLQKISDFFKRKFAGGSNKKESLKKIYAKAKIVRVKPVRGQGEDDSSQSTFPSSDPASRRVDCKCSAEQTTMPTTTPATESVTKNNDLNCMPRLKPNTCHCSERSTEMSPIINRVTTQQYSTNRPETDCSGTKAQLSHEIASKESTASTSEQTIIPSDRESLDNSLEQQAKMKSALEILNFIKKIEKLLKDQKVHFRIGDENGGVEIKFEKIYIRPGKNQSNIELKDVSETDKQKDMSGENYASEVIRHSVERPNLSTRNENARSVCKKRNKNVLNDESNDSSKLSSNANVQNDVSESNFDEASQKMQEQPKKYDNAILETDIEVSMPKSSQADKNALSNKSLPAKQWIDEERIASNDQSSSHGAGGRGSMSSHRKRKKRRRRKNRRHRLRKRTINETAGVVSKKGRTPYRRRRRRLSST